MLYEIICGKREMPSDDFIIVKKSGSQAGIEPTTFGELPHCSNQLSYRGPSRQSGHNSIMRQRRGKLVLRETHPFLGDGRISSVYFIPC